MKKLTFLFILCVFTSSIYAQNSKGDFTLAPKVGLNLSNYFEFESDVSYKSRLAPNFGVIGEYFFSEKWSARSGITYENMGVKDSYDGKDKLQYITIPLNASLHFGNKNNWYFNFGTTIAFLTNAVYEDTNGNEYDIKEALANNDFGINYGLGYSFRVAEKVSLFIDYQEFFGFINPDKADAIPFTILNTKSSINVGAILTL
ncbi:Outer membrane protein beta-barrel domain-containing protein [Pustulibacterium marinum]|uniref:Outer membrane protein beta-barrel domain-containing protein n=1 Tax=Pustulibacterium marinum TaxID=1224947 RepID=A0A1I7G502_9FLAO|nr:porin family protein [Pustulibacterium marinum]SFU43421.1 Outer membrane protein beta-barrel domain-containing protein [Pustulibacterium marinum]